MFWLSRLDLGMCYGCPLCSSLSPEVPAREFCLPPVCCHSDWTRWQLRQWCVGELCDTSLISSFDPLIDWLQEQRINRAHKSRFHSPLWSGLDKVQWPGLSVPPLSSLYGHTAIEGGSVPRWLSRGLCPQARGLRTAPVHNWLAVMGLFRSQGWKWNSWASL